MDEKDFVFWLKGFFDSKWASAGERGSEKLTGITLDAGHVSIIQERLVATLDNIKLKNTESVVVSGSIPGILTNRG